MERILRSVSSALWGFPMIFLIIGTGIFLTVYYRFFKYCSFGKTVRAAFSAKGNGDGISPFSSLCTFLSAAMGTGNIIGVAVCMKEGGAGAPIWMSIGALLSMPICFSETFLAVKNRDKGIGTAAYLKHKKLYSTFGFLSAILGMGPVIQVEAISSGIENFAHANGVVPGNIRVLVGVIIFGGLPRIASFSEKMIPFLTVLYLLSCSAILFVNRGNILSSVVYMFKSAFSVRTAVIGSAGGFFLTVSRGIAMGVFTNEAGLGTSGIALSQSGHRSPVSGGLVSVFGIFIDTIVMCNITALSIMVSGAYFTDLSGWDMTNEAFRTGFYKNEALGSFILMICLCFFAFASIIGWSYYGEVFFKTVFGGVPVKVYKILFSAAVFLGAFIDKGALFSISDIFNALMAYPNIITVISRRKEVRSELLKTEA